MLVVDCQVHIWGPDTPERPWPSVGTNVMHRFVPAESLVEEMRQAGVDRAVLVPPAFEGDRNDVVLAAVQKYPGRFGVMGRLALDKPESREKIAGWRDTPGMLGIRQSFHTPEFRRMLASGGTDWFWPAAEAAGIPLYVFCPGLLGEMADIARSHPALRITFSHFSLATGADVGELNTVAEKLQELAKYPNLAVTASALPCHASEPFPFPSLREPLRKVIEAFGANRVFWGSDLTRLPCTYKEVVDFGKGLDFLSPEELEQVMGAGLMTWLRWE